jgi:hypothetical protein
MQHVSQEGNRTHVRQVSLQVGRPLPDKPRIHQRRPTGPRELPSLPTQINKPLNLEKTKEEQMKLIAKQINNDKVNIAASFTSLSQLLGFYSACEDNDIRISEAVREKSNELNKLVQKQHELVIKMLAINKHELPKIDDNIQLSAPNTLVHSSSSPSRRDSSSSTEVYNTNLIF